MDVFETMKSRQSIRKFRKDPVPREHILRMAEAASWAPTAGNSQNFRFIAVQERETIDRMRGIVDEIVLRRRRFNVEVDLATATIRNKIGRDRYIELTWSQVRGYVRDRLTGQTAGATP